MAWRIYILPMVADAGPPPGRRPAYVRDAGAAVVTVLTYDNWALVRAQVTPEQHAAIVAPADATALPADLTQAIGAAALPTVQARLDAAGLPSDIPATWTWRQLVRAVACCCLVAQRVGGRGGRLLPVGVTLATRLGQLTTAQRNTLRDAAADLGIDTTPVLGTWTVRQVLRYVAQEYQPAIAFGGEDT